MTSSRLPSLPPTRDPDRPYAVALVCLGNICRSPIAGVVLEARLAEAGLADEVTVTSAGTGDWHVGKPMDPRAAQTLRADGYDPSRHRARQVDLAWFPAHDLVLAMDAQNRQDLRDLAPDEQTRERVALFRAWDPEDGPDAEVPDPYWGGADGFGDVLAIVERTSDVLADALAGHLRASPHR